MQTAEQYKQVIQECKALFIAKMGDYGPSWRILRTSSLTDQIYIKANRIRTLQNKKVKMVDEDIDGEFVGIVNYASMAIIQLRNGVVDKPDLTTEKAVALYDEVVEEAFSLMQNKNHDYDEAWRQMRVSSLTDIILVKLLRVKQIEDNSGLTQVSEGMDANFFDMINYAVFALILLAEQTEKKG